MTATVATARAAPAHAGIVLLAETPNAGRFHHRFLASPACGLDAAAAAELFARYRASPDGSGPDFLGVDREAVQRATGRPGREILLVAGLDVARLATAERDAIRSRLVGRFSRLAELTETIDWERHDELLLERIELAGWIDPAWPVAARRPSNRPAPETVNHRLRWIVGSSILVLAIMVYLVIARAPGTGAPVPKSDPEPPGQPARAVLADTKGRSREQYVHDLETRIKTWQKHKDLDGESPDNLLKDLAVSTGAKGPNEPSPTLAELAGDARIRRWLDAQAAGPFSLLDILDPAGATELKRLLPSQTFDSKGCLEYRKRLLAVRREFSNLRTSARNLPPAAWSDGGTHTWLNWIDESQRSRYKFEFDPKREPTIPLFAPDDLAFLRTLETFLDSPYARLALPKSALPSRHVRDVTDADVQALVDSLNAEFQATVGKLESADRKIHEDAKLSMERCLKSLAKLQVGQ